MNNALTPSTFGVWVGQKTRKSAFGGAKNKPGLMTEYINALLDDEARQDYIAQKAKDDAKAVTKVILTDAD